MSFPARKTDNSGDFDFEAAIQNINRALIGSMERPMIRGTRGTKNGIKIQRIDNFIIN